MNRITTTSELGSLIRSRRKELGYTQTELAEFCGCSLTFISKLENGKKTAEIEKVLRVISTLGLNITISKRGQR